MAIFDFLKKDKKELDYYESNDKVSFIDDLVNYFGKTRDVKDAYFGYLYNHKTNKNGLFLSVGLSGDEESIKTITWQIKTAHCSDLELYFASSISDSNLYKSVKEHGFNFYKKGKMKLLEQKIMKVFFDDGRISDEFLKVFKQSRFITFMRTFNKESDVLDFQTYVRNEREFIPLFTDEQMIEKGGMKEVPDDLTIIDFDYEGINGAVGGSLDNSLFVVNPGTPFELEFSVA